MGATAPRSFLPSYKVLAVLSFRIGSPSKDSGVRGSEMVGLAEFLRTLILEDLRVLILEAERVQVLTETSLFLRMPPESAGDSKVTTGGGIAEARRNFAISWIAACKSLKSSAISASVAPWHKTENGPHSKNISNTDSGRGGGGGEEDLEIVGLLCGRYRLPDLLAAV